MADQETRRTTGTADLESALDLIRAKRDADGLVALAQLHQANPDNRDIMGHYAFAALNQRDWATADRLLGRLQDTSGNNVSWETYYYRAWALAAQGHHERALEMSAQAVQHAPDRIRPRELGATLALRTHRHEQGLTVLRPIACRGTVRRLLRLSPHASFTSADPCSSLWMLCSYFADQKADPTRIPAYRRGWVTAVCAAIGRGIATPPLPWRAAAFRRRWLWRLWGLEPGFGRACFRCVQFPLAPGALEAYQAALDAAVDELLQFPLCSLAPYLRSITRGQDALALYNWTFTNRPVQFLHVGCFMGLTACLCALSLREAGMRGKSRIHTVDPYLLGAAVNPNEVFARIAARLDVSDMIERHTGYFNHCTPEDLPVEADRGLGVIGRDLLRRIGPCDAFLVDGDHSEIGVTADVLLASEFLAARGTVLLHDVRSISSVRRGLALFLATEGVREAYRYREIEPANVDGVGLLNRRRPGIATRLRDANRKRSSYEIEGS